MFHCFSARAKGSSASEQRHPDTLLQVWACDCLKPSQEDAQERNNTLENLGDWPFPAAAQPAWLVDSRVGPQLSGSSCAGRALLPCSSGLGAGSRSQQCSGDVKSTAYCWGCPCGWAQTLRSRPQTAVEKRTSGSHAAHVNVRKLQRQQFLT